MANDLSSERRAVERPGDCSQTVANKPDDVPAESSSEDPASTDQTPVDPGEWELDDPSPSDDDSRYDVFIPDDDERDPLPDPHDFWIDTSGESTGENRRSAPAMGT